MRFSRHTLVTERNRIVRASGTGATVTNAYTYYRLARECELRAIDVKSEGDRLQLLQIGERLKSLAAQSNVCEFKSARRFQQAAE